MTKFVAFGGVWLDEIHVPGKDVLKDVPGGTVAFATFGARLFASNNPSEIALLVKTGYDFPPTLIQTFKHWAVDLRILRQENQLSARGRVHYGKTASERVFEPLTPPLLTVPSDLVASGHVEARVVHFFDTPAAVEKQVDELVSLRRGGARPVVVWEPQAKSCSPATLEAHRKLIGSGKVDVFSPNHAELGKLFGSELGQTLDLGKETVQRLAAELVQSGAGGGECGIVIRCAEDGCYVLPAGQSGGTWMPAYHAADSDRVVDPTGAGNAFLGGAAMGWLESGDLVTAAAYGSVAASFAVEEVGLREAQGLDVSGRLNEFNARLASG